jgi:hypothetical protein
MSYPQGDLNADGAVNGTDFALLAGNFARTLPATPPSALIAQTTAAVRPAVTAPAPAKQPAPPPPRRTLPKRAVPTASPVRRQINPG